MTASDNETDTGEDDLKPGVIKLTVTQPDPIRRPTAFNLWRAPTPIGLTCLTTGRRNVGQTVHTATKPINKTEYEHKGSGSAEEELHFRLF